MKRALITCLLCFPFFLFAQENQVNNITSKQEGDVLTIYYDLEGNPEKQYNVSLFLELESDSSYRYEPQSISGDIRNVTPGPGKEIKWNVQQDLPEDFERDNFRFTISAHPKNSNTLYYILGGGAAILGGIAYIVTQSGDKENEPTGSITIEVPGEM